MIRNLLKVAVALLALCALSASAQVVVSKSAGSKLGVDLSGVQAGGGAAAAVRRTLENNINRSGWLQAKVRYQWLRDGTPMLGRVGRTFTPQTRDVGHQISCHVAVTYAPALNSLGATSPQVQVG